MKTILQIPIEKKLRDQAVLVAQKKGFSSLQDVMRLFLTKFASGEMTVLFADERPLSAKAVKRYGKMLHDMDKGKSTKSFASMKDFLADLNS